MAFTKKRHAGSVNTTTSPWRQNLNFSRELHKIAGTILHERVKVKLGRGKYIRTGDNRHKLTDDEVRELRRQFEASHHKTALCRAWAVAKGCHAAYIYAVARGELRGNVI